MEKLAVDVIIAGVAVCGKTSFDALKNFSSFHNALPILVTAATEDRKLGTAVIEAGAQDFFELDNLNPEELFTRITYSIIRNSSLQDVREELRRFQLACKATHTMIWDWNLRSGNIYRSQDGWKMIFKSQTVPAGNTEEEWINKLHPEDRPKLSNIKNEIMKSTSKVEYEIESRILQSDDTVGYVLDRAFVVRDENGSAIRVVGAAQDITEKKIAETSVHLSEQRFRSLVQNGSDLMAILDTTGRYMYVSPASSKIIGINPEAFEKQSFADFIHPDDKQAVEKKFKELPRGKAMQLPLYRVKNGNGQWRWIETTLTDLSSTEAIMGIVSNSRDVSDRKLAEEQLLADRRHQQNEITEAIIAAQEKERSLIGREMHDNINQLLGAIRLYIDMARKDLTNAEGYLKSASDFTLNAIDEIRKLSKSLITPSLEGVSLEDAVYDIINDISRVHPIRFRFTSTDLQENDFKDEFKLNVLRIIQEQVNNILKHSQANTASIQLKSKNNNFLLSVKDNGVGHDPFTGKKGVGTANIASRAEIYKGEVMIDSAPGKGYTLKVKFTNPSLYLNN